MMTNDQPDDTLDEITGQWNPKDAAVRRALVNSHRQIVRFLQRRLGNEQEAEEVLQAFTLRSIERSSQLRNVNSVRGWLSRILATTIADHQRRYARQREQELVMDPSDLEQWSVEPDAELDEAVCNCLYKLLPTLKSDYAEMIWRVDLLDEPRTDVAASLGMTPNNLNVRLHRGRQAQKSDWNRCACPVHGFLDCRCEEHERTRRHREAP